MKLGRGKIDKMKYIYSILICLVSAPVSLWAQTGNIKLTIYSITGYSDGYLIKAVDALTGDTLNLISERDTSEKIKGYKKIMIGEKYAFKIDDISKRFAAM